MKSAWDVEEKLLKLNKKIIQYGTCKRNPHRKNKVSMGCVREIPEIEIKPAWDV